MSFKTPRGRQIDIPIEEAFTLMARIGNRGQGKDAHYVLRTCEALDNIPEVIAYAAGFCVVFLANWEPWVIVAAMSAGGLLGITLLTSWTYFVIPVLVSLLRFYNYVPELIRIFLPMGVVFWGLGWVGLLFWILGFFIGALLNVTVISVASRRTYRETGRVLGRAERCFARACQICARQSGVNLQDETTTSDADSDESLSWEECWEAYRERNPES
ncbi:MAG: hypothetical protein IH984_07770 [Planctomycetes bacterium]|nr:hypothetical protein [Planctomycetota bacterium]